MPRIRDLLERQAVDLGHLQDREITRVLRGLEDARRDLRARLTSTTLPASQHRLQFQLAQVDSAILGLQDRMGQALTAAERTLHHRALDNLIGVVDRGERTFRDHGAKIEMATLRRFAAEEGLALHRYSVQRYGRQVVEAIQREVVAGYAQGLTPRELARRIAGVDGVLARHKGRAELIARMELARAYDAGHQAALEETAAYDEPDDPDPLLKKADEFLDHRNHPFSRLLHGRAVRPRQEWEVPLTDAAAGRGLVWRVTGNIAHGSGYPAHYNDRGRQIPWRASWGGETYRPQVSFRAGGLKKSDRTALRAIAAGREPRRLSRVGRRHLELSGFIDGQGRLTPEGERAAFPHRLQPSLPPDPSRRMAPPEAAGRKPTDRSLLAEQAAGDAFMRMGYDVVPVSREAGKRTPDMLVEGVRTDVTLWDKKLDTVYRRIKRKVGDQADVVVVQPGPGNDINHMLDHMRRKPIKRLRELWVLEDGELRRVLG